MRAINAPARSPGRRDAATTSSETAPAFVRSTGATMQQAGNVNVIVGMAAMVAVLAAATPQASAGGLLKLAPPQRGGWGSAPPGRRQSGRIFPKHRNDPAVGSTPGGAGETSLTPGGPDGGV